MPLPRGRRRPPPPPRPSRLRRPLTERPPRRQIRPLRAARLRPPPRLPHPRPRLRASRTTRFKSPVRSQASARRSCPSSIRSRCSHTPFPPSGKTSHTCDTHYDGIHADPHVCYTQAKTDCRDVTEPLGPRPPAIFPHVKLGVQIHGALEGCGDQGGPGSSSTTRRLYAPTTTSSAQTWSFGLRRDWTAVINSLAIGNS
jgi:hypothetical protein